MRPLRLPALPALIALALLGACRDASETLVGPPPDAASLAEAVLSSRSRGVSLDVNDSSVAVGWIEGNQAFRWPRGGNLQRLGSLGGSYSRAAFINAAGHVAGTATTADGTMHVFLWSASGGMRSLGTLGGSSVTVTALSDSGHVVGWGSQANGGTTGFIAREGSPLQLIPGYPTDVNGAGTVVGRTGTAASTPFRWTAAGGAQPMPGPWGSGAWGTPQLNEAGVVAGMVTVAGATKVVRWIASGGYKTLGECGSAPSHCVGEAALNERGAVAWATTTWNPPARTGTHTLRVWTPGGAVRQAPVAVVPHRLLLGDNGSVAGTGQVVNTYTTYRSFLWQNGLPVGYYRGSRQAYALNARGDVVGATHPAGSVKLWDDRPTWFGDADNHPPVAGAGPYTLQAGVPLNLDGAQVASDPDGDPLRAYWGGFPNRCCWRRMPPTPWRRTVTYQWNIPGEYTVDLTVADLDSLQAHATARVTVLPRTPGDTTTTRLGRLSMWAGGPLLLDAARPDDPTGERYSYRWSFDASERRARPYKTYADTGTYDLGLEVRDSAGALVEKVQTRAVIDQRGFVPELELYVEGSHFVGFEFSIYMMNPRSYADVDGSPFDYRGIEVSISCELPSYGPWIPVTGPWAGSGCPAPTRSGTLPVGAKVRYEGEGSPEFVTEKWLSVERFPEWDSRAP